MSDPGPIQLPLSELNSPQAIAATMQRLYQDEKAWKTVIEWGIAPPGMPQFTEEQLVLLYDRLLLLIGRLRALPSRDLASYRDVSDRTIIHTPELLTAYLLIASDETALFCLLFYTTGLSAYKPQRGHHPRRSVHRGSYHM